MRLAIGPEPKKIRSGGDMYWFSVTPLSVGGPRKSIDGPSAAALNIDDAARYSDMTNEQELSTARYRPGGAAR